MRAKIESFSETCWLTDMLCPFWPSASALQSLTRSGCCVSPQGWGEAYDRTAALWEERTGTPYKLHWSEIRSTYNRAKASSRGRQH